MQQQKKKKERIVQIQFKINLFKYYKFIFDNKRVLSYKTKNLINIYKVKKRW